MLMDRGIVLQLQLVILMDRGIIFSDVVKETWFLVMVMNESNIRYVSQKRLGQKVNI